MKPVKILLVEDEPFIAQDLALRLENMGFIITDIADNGADALRSLTKNPPDLVLLDINIKGKTDGIETAARITAQTDIPFIYLTALADDATVERAKKTRPAAYLLKPFNDRRIKIAIDLAVFKTTAEEKTPAFSPRKANKDSIFLKHRRQYFKIILHDLLWLEADGNYSTLFTQTDKIVQTTPLGHLVEKLNYPSLVRTHRSYVVNIDHVKRFEEHRLFINDTEIPISRAHRAELLGRLLDS